MFFCFKIYLKCCLAKLKLLANFKLNLVNKLQLPIEQKVRNQPTNVTKFTFKNPQTSSRKNNFRYFSSRLEIKSYLFHYQFSSELRRKSSRAQTKSLKAFSQLNSFTRTLTKSSSHDSTLICFQIKVSKVHQLNSLRIIWWKIFQSVRKPRPFFSQSEIQNETFISV